jgi:predicted enzyme related to lactoylglutathione lyase
MNAMNLVIGPCAYQALYVYRCLSRESTASYSSVFGWKLRQRGDGHIAFDDTVGAVSGTWVTGRPPASEPGLLVYIMVDSVAATVEAVTAHGGEIAQPVGADAPEITARFRDPSGNVIGLYQDRAANEA